MKNLKQHFLDQANDRMVHSTDIINALQKPLYITDLRYNEISEPSVQYIGEKATVAFNPKTDTAISTWPTNKSKTRKYKNRMGE